MLKNLLHKIEKLRAGELEGFKTLKEHIQSLDEFQYQQIVERLKFQIEIVEKYNPKVRPAIDPVVSTELGIYRRLDDFEIGKLLDYPECCIKSFVDCEDVACTNVYPLAPNTLTNICAFETTLVI